MPAKYEWLSGWYARKFHAVDVVELAGMYKKGSTLVGAMSIKRKTVCGIKIYPNRGSPESAKSPQGKTQRCKTCIRFLDLYSK